MVASAGFINGVLNGRIDGVGCHRLGMNLDSGTLSVKGANGFDLSTSNPGYVTMNSKLNPGQLVNSIITANQGFQDSTGTGDNDGVFFRYTTGNSVNNLRPYFLYACLNLLEDTVVFGYSSIPNLFQVPPADNIYTPSSAAAVDSQYGIFLFSDVTKADYAAAPLLCLGSFRMTFQATTDDFVISTIDSQEGIGKFNDTRWFPCASQTNFGGSSTHIYLRDNGGTPPTFSTGAGGTRYTYRLMRDGTCQVSFSFTGDGGADGSGAVQAQLVTPYTIGDTINIVTNLGRPMGAGFTSYAGTTVRDVVYIGNSGGESFGLRASNSAVVSGYDPITWALYTNGARCIIGSSIFTVWSGAADSAT
jgi:hypothetical protein